METKKVVNQGGRDPFFYKIRDIDKDHNLVRITATDGDEKPVGYEDVPMPKKSASQAVWLAFFGGWDKVQHNLVENFKIKVRGRVHSRRKSKGSRSRSSTVSALS